MTSLSCLRRPENPRIAGPDQPRLDIARKMADHREAWWQNVSAVLAVLAN